MDELLSIAPSRVYDSETREEFTLDPQRARPQQRVVRRPQRRSTTSTRRSRNFLALIGGDGPVAAIESIRLNGAALAINAGVVDGWPAALKLAADTMAAGEPARRIEQMRAHATAGASVS